MSAAGDTAVVHGEEAWTLANGSVSLAVTRRGGHMAPVVFGQGADAVSPYYMSPWQGEGHEMPCPCLVPLRGDFFSLPFGVNATALGDERHPPHGETAGSPWSFGGIARADGVSTLSIAIEPKVRPARVTRHLSLVEGHPAVYSRTIVEGFAGPATYAHHSVLRLPEEERSLLVSSSPFAFGMTFPGVFSDPRRREYQSLAQGAVFHDLAAVPADSKSSPVADCSAFPCRFGYTDLLQCFEAESASAPAWVAAVNTQEHWLWFAFKSPRTLPGRILWMDNHGRHGWPWNGRNACLGIEDCCTFFDIGLAESSAPNAATARGARTCAVLDGKVPLEVRHIQGAVRVPAGFGQVKEAQFSPSSVLFTDVHGLRVEVKVKAGFIGCG